MQDLLILASIMLFLIETSFEVRANSTMSQLKHHPFATNKRLLRHANAIVGAKCASIRT